VQPAAKAVPGAIMALSRRDKIGLSIVAALFIVFCLILYFTIKPLGPGVESPGDSYFVQQRVRNLKK
jgi:hypothetical protein